MKNNQYYSGPVSEDQFEQIERFFQNKMQQPEREAFEELLHSDEKLKEEFTLYQKMRASLEVNNFFAEREKENRKTENIPRTPVRRISSFKKTWWAAASVLIVLLAGAWFLFAPSPSEKLYGKYFSIDPGLPTNMGDEEEYEFFRGMVDYKMAEFEKAILRWEKLYAIQPQDGQLAYFLGVAWLNTGNADKSKPFLQTVAQDTKNPFQQSATWYLALAHVKNEEFKAAYRLLQKIPNYPGAPDLQAALENYQ